MGFLLNVRNNLRWVGDSRNSTYLSSEKDFPTNLNHNVFIIFIFFLTVHIPFLKYKLRHNIVYLFILQRNGLRRKSDTAVREIQDRMIVRCSTGTWHLDRVWRRDTRCSTTAARTRMCAACYNILLCRRPFLDCSDYCFYSTQHNDLMTRDYAEDDDMLPALGPID